MAENNLRRFKPSLSQQRAHMAEDEDDRRLLKLKTFCEKCKHSDLSDANAVIEILQTVDRCEPDIFWSACVVLVFQDAEPDLTGDYHFDGLWRILCDSPATKYGYVPPIVWALQHYSHRVHTVTDVCHWMALLFLNGHWICTTKRSKKHLLSQCFSGLDSRTLNFAVAAFLLNSRMPCGFTDCIITQHLPTSSSFDKFHTIRKRCFDTYYCCFFDDETVYYVFCMLAWHEALTFCGRVFSDKVGSFLNVWPSNLPSYEGMGGGRKAARQMWQRRKKFRIRVATLLRTHLPNDVVEHVILPFL